MNDIKESVNEMKKGITFKIRKKNARTLEIRNKKERTLVLER